VATVGMGDVVLAVFAGGGPHAALLVDGTAVIQAVREAANAVRGDVSRFAVRDASSILHFFFFSSRRRHTRSKRDWSSDVCSSDLTPYRNFLLVELRKILHQRIDSCRTEKQQHIVIELFLGSKIITYRTIHYYQIGRASCRERV